MPSIQRSLGLLAFICISIGIVWGIIQSIDRRQRLEHSFLRLEKLLSVYSITAFRSRNQLPPTYIEDLDFGGAAATLSCPEIEWGTPESRADGELLNCLLLPKVYWIARAGEQFEAPQIFPTENLTPEFSWDSVFGYELDLRFLPISDSIYEADQNCVAELARFSSNDECFIGGYSIFVSGLPASDGFSFSARQGEIVYNDDGSLNRLWDWRVSIDELENITLGDLNRVIQTTFREIGISNTQVEQVAPALEAAFRKRNRDFFDGIVKSLSATDDLSDLGKYLRGS